MESPTVGVVGLGLLGRGIATCLVSRGLRVIGFDLNPDVMAAAQAHMAAALDEMHVRKALPASLWQGWEDRYQSAESLTDLTECQFVIESVVEDLEAKRSLFARLEEILAVHIPIGSNTSALPISRLQSKCRHPERVIGMHWAEPCHLTRFLEVIRGDKTDDATTQAAIQLGELAGKEPSLVQKDVPGFIVNRLGYAMYREAFWLLEQGVADVETIDRSFRNALSVWADVAGPFRWMDLTGLPAYASVMEHLLPELSRSTDVPHTMKELVASGARGIANGRGFYEYTPEEAKRWEQILTENVWRNTPALPEKSPPVSP